MLYRVNNICMLSFIVLSFSVIIAYMFYDAILEVLFKFLWKTKGED